MPLIYDFNGKFKDISLAGENLRITRLAGNPDEPALSIHVPVEVGIAASEKLTDRGYNAISSPDEDVPDKWRIIIMGKASMKKAALEEAVFNGSGRYLPNEITKS